ncbi:MAG: NAD-dependent deacylase [Chloroflexaceae bacterium]|jgi:NAD-dependent deacetylase|nr:NAD-dependent deacylase [Chloroflexaceae bacterium]
MQFASQLVERLRVAERVTVLTGAGVSAESGIPTFRDAQTGLWARYDPTELATPQAFVRNPRLVWDWYAYRRDVIEQAEPNPAHYALVDMEQHYANFTLITQNVDGLHWRAGSRNLFELHGNISRIRCFECAAPVTGWDDDGELPPRCPHCGGLGRPDVVWFGEGLPAPALREAERATERADVFLSIGTSAMVQPAASLPLRARRAGAYVIEINPEETSLAVIADEWLRGPAGVILPELFRQAGGERQSPEEG